MCPRGPQNPWHIFKLLSVYQYELDHSKEVLHVSIGQRAAKLEMIKVFKATFSQSYVVNRCSLGVLHLIRTCSFAALWVTESYSTSLKSLVYTN